MKASFSGRRGVETVTWWTSGKLHRMASSDDTALAAEGAHSSLRCGAPRVSPVPRTFRTVVETDPNRSIPPQRLTTSAILTTCLAGSRDRHRTRSTAARKQQLTYPSLFRGMVAATTSCWRGSEASIELSTKCVSRARVLTGAPSSSGTNGSNHDLSIFWAKQHQPGGCKCWMVKSEVVRGRAFASHRERMCRRQKQKPRIHGSDQRALWRGRRALLRSMHMSIGPSRRVSNSRYSFLECHDSWCWWPQARPSIASTAMLNLRCWKQLNAFHLDGVLWLHGHIREDLGADTSG